MYKPGGYHPAHVGDILPKKSSSECPESRDRILLQLGYGAHATI